MSSYRIFECVENDTIESDLIILLEFAFMIIVRELVKLVINKILLLGKVHDHLADLDIWNFK